MSVSTFKIAVILWYAEVVSLNPAQARCTQYNIYVIKIDSDLRQVGGFLQLLQFPPPIKLTATI